MNDVTLGETRSGPWRACGPIHPSPILRQSWSVAARSRERRRRAPCWYRPTPRRSSCSRNCRPRSIRRRRDRDQPAVIAVGAGIRHHAHLDRGQSAVTPRAGLDADPHRMPRRRGDELFFARELELDGRPVLSTASVTISSTSISCLAPKPPPMRSQNTRTFSASRPKMPHSARRVRNGVWVLDRILSRPCLIQPADGAMRFQMRVLYALGRVGRLRTQRRPAAKPSSTLPTWP